jgi:hypothetical protein
MRGLTVNRRVSLPRNTKMKRASNVPGGSRGQVDDCTHGQVGESHQHKEEVHAEIFHVENYPDDRPKLSLDPQQCNREKGEGGRRRAG